MKEINTSTPSDQVGDAQTDIQIASESGLSDPSRRSFTKLGAIATSGVLLSLASRPVLAAQCSISGMQSGNTSNPNQVVCQGCTPGFWLNPVGCVKWSPYTPGTCLEQNGNGSCKTWKSDGTKFHAVFSGSRHGTKTMAEVIQLSGVDDDYQLGAHACAALLNALHLQNFGYSATDIINMWSTYHGSEPDRLKITYKTLNERFCPYGR